MAVFLKRTSQYVYPKSVFSTNLVQFCLLRLHRGDTLFSMFTLGSAFFFIFVPVFQLIIHIPALES